MVCDLLRRSRGRRAAGGSTAIALALVLAAAIGGCSSGGKNHARAKGTPAARPVQVRSFLEHLIPPPAGSLPGVRAPGEIRRLVAGLPVERKVAQLLLVGFSGQDPTAPFFATLRRMDLGGVALARQNYTGAAGLAALTNAVANAAAGHLHQPPLIVAQQEGGEFSAFPDLPPSLAAGDLGGTADAAAEAARAATTLKGLGLNGVLGPDVDVGAGGTDPLGPRAFSDDTHQVSDYAGVVVSAYRRARMLSAPSHFPGIGAAAQDTDEGPTSVGLGMGALAARDVPPFRSAIRAGAPAVLVGHASYAPDSFVVPASLSHAIETNLLRAKLGFRGIAITDDLEAGAIADGNSVPTAAVRAIQAGADMVWISSPESDWMAAYRALLAAVRSRKITLLRLNTAVTRIVTAKRELGLRNRPRPLPVVPGALPPTGVPGVTGPTGVTGVTGATGVP